MEVLYAAPVAALLAACVWLVMRARAAGLARMLERAETESAEARTALAAEWRGRPVWAATWRASNRTWRTRRNPPGRSSTCSAAPPRRCGRASAR